MPSFGTNNTQNKVKHTNNLKQVDNIYPIYTSLATDITLKDRLTRTQQTMKCHSLPNSIQ